MAIDAQSINKEENILSPKEYYHKLLREISAGDYTYSSPRGKKEKIDDILADKERIKNIGLRQDIALKSATLKMLFYFLASETIVIFVFSFFQGIKAFGFHLEEWSFKLLVIATILQITAMLLVAVKHLFPQNKNS